MKKIIVRLIISAVLVCCMLIFIRPMFISVRNLGNFFGVGFCLFLLLVVIFFDKIKLLWKKKAGKIVISAVTGLLSLCVIYAGILSGMMIYAASDYSTDADALIVLGCRVQKSGQPSLMLKNRLEAAYAYLSENETAVVIVSGGKGSDEPRSEAEVMKEYLISKGIEESRIFTEDKSSDTDENIAYSLVIAKENGINLEKIAIVTDAFHQLRAQRIVQSENIDASAVSAETPLWLLPTYWIREWFALSEEFVFG